MDALHNNDFYVIIKHQLASLFARLFTMSSCSFTFFHWSIKNHNACAYWINTCADDELIRNSIWENDCTVVTRQFPFIQIHNLLLFMKRKWKKTHKASDENWKWNFSQLILISRNCWSVERSQWVVRLRKSTLQWGVDINWHKDLAISKCF